MHTDFTVGGFQFRHGPARKRLREFTERDEDDPSKKQANTTVAIKDQRKIIAVGELFDFLHDELDKVDFPALFPESIGKSGSSAGEACLRDTLRHLLRHVNGQLSGYADLSELHPMANEFFQQLLLHAISDDTVISYSAERELVFPPLSTRRFKNPQNLVNFEKKQYLLSKRDFYMEGLRAIEELQQSHITRKGVDSFPGSLSTKQVQQPDLEGVAKLEVAQSQLSEVINIIEDISDVGRSISTLCDVASDKIQSASRMIRERTFNIESRPTNAKLLLSKPDDLVSAPKQLLVQARPSKNQQAVAFITSNTENHAFVSEKNLDVVPEETPTIIRKITSKRHVQ